MNEFGGLCPVQEPGRTAFVRFDAYKPEMFRRGRREMLNRTPGSSSASAVHFALVARHFLCLQPQSAVNSDPTTGSYLVRFCRTQFAPAYRIIFPSAPPVGGEF